MLLQNSRSSLSSRTEIKKEVYGVSIDNNTCFNLVSFLYSTKKTSGMDSVCLVCVWKQHWKGWQFAMNDFESGGVTSAGTINGRWLCSTMHCHPSSFSWVCAAFSVWNMTWLAFYGEESYMHVWRHLFWQGCHYFCGQESCLWPSRMLYLLGMACVFHPLILLCMIGCDEERMVLPRCISMNLFQIFHCRRQ